MVQVLIGCCEQSFHAEGVFFYVLPILGNNDGIGNEIEKQQKHAQYDLCFPVQPCRVNDRYQIMVNKSTVISGAGSCRSQLVFQRSERAYPAEQFDAYRPYQGRYMKQAPFYVEKRKNGAEYDKENEQKVKKNYGICQDGIGHYLA